MNVITGKTKVIGIIGFPVSHSLSPLMHNVAFSEMGLDYAYVPFPVHPESLADAVKGLKNLGVEGFNVTIPHKTAIIPHLDRISPEAKAIGAVNTVRREGEFFVGYNTDGIGFLRSLREDLHCEATGTKVVLLGAGGAARSALAALCGAGACLVVVANRTRERAEEMVRANRELHPACDFKAISLSADELFPLLRDTDLLVNTSSVGMEHTTFADLDLSIMKKGAKVYDMVYAPPVTPLLQEARDSGLQWANGLGMLAGQGEEAFRLWTGVLPPPGFMKERLLEALRG